jgi:hypothetical protein
LVDIYKKYQQQRVDVVLSHPAEWLHLMHNQNGVFRFFDENTKLESSQSRKYKYYYFYRRKKN